MQRMAKVVRFLSRLETDLLVTSDHLSEKITVAEAFGGEPNKSDEIHNHFSARWRHVVLMIRSYIKARYGWTVNAIHEETIIRFTEEKIIPTRARLLFEVHG